MEKQASTYQARQLHRQVKVLGRVKTENEKIYYSVDTIYTAIDADRQISFSYLEWTTTKTLKPRRNGKTYVVSPLALIWDDENYYLAAYDAEADCIKHYRVDKMKNTKVEEKKREGQDFLTWIRRSIPKARSECLAAMKNRLPCFCRKTHWRHYGPVRQGNGCAGSGKR